LLSKNWIIIVPGLVAGLVGGIVTGLLTPQMGPYSIGPLAFGWLVRLVLALILLALSIASIAYTTGMAGAAWQRGTTTLADGTLAFERESGHVLGVMIAMWLAGLVATVLSFVTFGLAFLAYIFFFIYALPSAVVGDHGGVAAMSESYRIALHRAVPTAITVIALGLVIAVVGVVAGLLGAVPLIGPIIGAVIFQAIVAYVTLVVVGEYLALRENASQPPAVG